MQDEIRRLLERISKKHNLPFETVVKIYRAPYEMARKVWSEIDYDNPQTYTACNVYIIKMGVFAIKPKRVEYLKKLVQDGKRRYDEQAEDQGERSSTDE